MSTSVQTYTRALQIYASSNADIPYPQIISSGVNTVSLNRVANPSVNFTTLGVQPGDIVYNTSLSAAATVTRVISATELELNANIFTAANQNYKLYQASSQTTIGNRGCCIYIGVNDNIQVETIGGDLITFPGVKQGTILPVQVKRLISALNDSHIALW